MSSVRGLARRSFVLAVASLSLALAMPSQATGPGGQPRIGGHVVGVRPLPPMRNPAGPTPLNPAGPTPLNPAGPTPLNPTGPSIPFPRQGFVIGPGAGVHVGVVGGGAQAGFPIGGSYYCQVHDRGFASQSLFFEHLAVMDGLPGDVALSYLIENGGVWIFPSE